MNRINYLIVLIIICSSHFVTAQESNIVPGNIIAILKSNNDAAQLVSSLQTINGINTNFKIDKYISKSMNIVLFDFDASAINQKTMLNEVKINPLVRVAQFNHTFQKRSVPNDSLFPVQWNMNNTGQNGGTPHADIDALDAWEITTGGVTAQGDTIVVAIVDDGFDLTHPDINYWVNRNEIPNNGVDDDGDGYIDDVIGWNGWTNNDILPVAPHGTHVTGIAGARGNNHIGVTGVNQNVRIMPLSYGNATSNTQLESAAVACYSYVYEQRKLYNQTNGVKGAFVVATNSSFGINNGQPSNYPIWCAMYDSLGAVGVLSAAATANVHSNIDAAGDIPTACPSNWLVTVTNTTDQDFLNPQAAFGATTIDLGAPGTSITSTVPPDTYAGGSAWTGTSMASPHVAGAIALMYSVQCAQFIADYKANPAAMALIVKDSLLNATDPNADLAGITVSGGRLNLFKAVRSVLHYCGMTTDVGIANYGNENTGLFIKNVFPNPADNTANIIYNNNGNENLDMVFTNILGQEIKRTALNSITKGINNIQIDLNSIEKGIYFITISSPNQNSNVMKLVVD